MCRHYAAGHPRWWERQLKIQRTRWREALWIASGEVSRAASPFLSRQALQDIRYRRLATLDFLKSRELENTRNGERVDLIDKVMGSIANPDIRRMELMTMLAGIERYATAHQHIGMLVTFTAPATIIPPVPAAMTGYWSTPDGCRIALRPK
ncbi:hypothetical protein HAT93_00013 [Dickeya solani]|nr:hypothetical protein [Dickeya solani]